MDDAISSCRIIHGHSSTTTITNIISLSCYNYILQVKAICSDDGRLSSQVNNDHLVCWHSFSFPILWRQKYLFWLVLFVTFSFNISYILQRHVWSHLFMQRAGEVYPAMSTLFNIQISPCQEDLCSLSPFVHVIGRSTERHC